jgi:ankyrin repeat protein
MESAQRDICTSRSVDDPSLRRSEENVALEIPPQHYPIRLMDVVEVDESTSEDDNPCPLGFGREDDKPRVLDDENDDTNPTSTTVDYQNFFTSIKLGLVLPVRSMLEKGADIERLADDGLSPLAIAMKADQVEMVELLLEHGANANSRSRRMSFLVHASMRRNHGIRLLQMLLDHGANLNAISGPGQYNALHWAASEGRAEAVDFLISKGMDMETKCSEDRTPLMLAAERGHEHVINILWAQGADLEAESELGGTALFWAACGSSLPALVTLIAKGANVNHKDTKGHSMFLDPIDCTMAQFF